MRNSVNAADSMDNLDDPLGSVRIIKSGVVHTEKLLKAFKEYFLKKECLKLCGLHYEQLNVHSDYIGWEGHSFQKVIFCEGYKAQFNPYFDWLPFNSVKGEVLHIEMDDTNLPDCVINKGKWCNPLGGRKWVAGSTYIWDELNCNPTEAGKREILEGLDFIKCPKKIIHHQAAVRPVMLDQNPIMGAHPKIENIGIFNGLGSKGFLKAPYLARQYADRLNAQKPLNIAYKGDSHL